MDKVMRRGSDVSWLTVDDVSAQLQVSIETVRRWIRSGDLDVLQIGGRRGGYRIHPDALDKFITARYGPGGIQQKETDESH